MYYSNITNPELQYFKDLQTPNFTIKLSDILHQTQGTYDNKLFQIEEILPNNIYRIVPLFHYQQINSNNPKDTIIDQQVIIAHQEPHETYITFTSNTEEETRDYYPYGKYYQLGDQLTLPEFNYLVMLLRQNTTQKDTFQIQNTIHGNYGTYQFQLEHATILDTGIIITTETKQAKPQVRLTNNVFRYSTYTLKLDIIHYTGTNILDDTNPVNYKKIDTLELPLTPNIWTPIPINTIPDNYIISINTTVEITHNKPEIHMLTGLSITNNPTPIQTNENTEIYAQLLDHDGNPYTIPDANGKTIYFYEAHTPTLKLTTQPTIIQNNENSEIYATLKDTQPANRTVYFYEAHTPTLNLTTQPTIIENNENTEIYATLKDIQPANRLVYFFEKHDQETITVTSEPNIIESGESTELYATLKDSDGSLIKNSKVYFYSSANPTPSLTVSVDKDILSYYDSESATVTAKVVDGYNIPISGETVLFKQGETVLDSVITDSDGEAEYTYTSQGAGDVTIIVECMNLQETYSLEDCWNTLLAETTTTNSSGTKISSIGLDTIHNIKNEDFIFEFDGYGNGTLNIGAKDQWSSSSANYRLTIGYADNKNYWSVRTSSTNEGYGSNASTTTWYHYKITKEGTSVKFYVDDTLIQTRTVSFFSNYDTWSIYSIIWGSATQKYQNVRIKPL